MPETSSRPAGIEAFLAERGRLVEGALDRYLPPADAPPELIHQAMRHSVFAGGKRLRPARVLPAACAVELIHTYSLIHDDLPAMDNSPTRRGRPTCHVVFGEALAVLAGDALHALAFELLARNAEVDGCSPDRVVRATRELARGIGTAGMVGGQVLDILAMGGRRPPQGVEEIHRLKTGSLIRACLVVGAILGGASEPDVEVVGRYGEHLGLAFQIVDDILDVVGEAEKLGKGTGSDASQAKVTFPAVFGLDQSRAYAAEATRRAVASLEPLGPRGGRLRDLALYLLQRER